MPKVDLITTSGQKKALVSLPKEIFAAKVNLPLMTQAVRVYLANQRKSKAQTKTRGQVRGSRRKIWRQKGTGRARHGDRYAPIFVGGGRAHGPTGQENHQLKMSKKMRRLALFSALTSKLNEKEILVVEGLGKIEPKTKIINQALAKITPGPVAKGTSQKLMIIMPGLVENLIRGAKNLKKVELAQASLLNPYQVLNGGRLILMKESLEVMEKTFLGKKPKSLAKK